LKTLVTQADVTASGSQVLADDLSLFSTIEFLLNVSAAAAGAGDTLDVFIQSSGDDGTTYDDFIHFTQVLGNGGAKKLIARWSANVAPETEIKAPQDKALAAGVQQGPIASKVRVAWVVAGAGADFDFTLSMEGVRRR
jgi:hypothetical protein